MRDERTIKLLSVKKSIHHDQSIINSISNQFIYSLY